MSWTDLSANFVSISRKIPSWKCVIWKCTLPVGYQRRDFTPRTKLISSLEMMISIWFIVTRTGLSGPIRLRTAHVNVKRPTLYVWRDVCSIQYVWTWSEPSRGSDLGIIFKSRFSAKRKIQWDNFNDCNQYHKDYINCEKNFEWIQSLIERIEIVRLKSNGVIEELFARSINRFERKKSIRKYSSWTHFPSKIH